LKSNNISKCSSKKAARNKDSRRAGNRPPDQAMKTTSVIRDLEAHGEAAEARQEVLIEVANTVTTQAELITTEAIMAPEKEKNLETSTSLLRLTELIMKNL